MNRLEVKAALGIDEHGNVTGLAWPFGSPDRVGDMIQPGAFSGMQLPIPMLFAHNPETPVGVWTHAAETAKGLEVQGRLLVDEVPKAKEVFALVREGAISGLSIGFSTKKAAPRKGGGRIISALELCEVSLVAIPCHPGARLGKDASSVLAIAEALNRAAIRLNPKGN